MLYVQAGCTALAIAAMAGEADIVRLLIAEGARVDYLGRGRSMTALMAAAALGRTNTIQALVAAGARVDLFDHTGGTALMYAAQAGQVDAIKTLLALGADINQQAPDTGRTALIEAVLYQKVESARTLVSAGANLDLQMKTFSLTGSTGISALALARQAGNTELVHILEQARARD